VGSRRTGTYALVVAITCWGILLGGIAYSHLVYFPVYLSDLPESAVVVTGPYGLNEAIFWILLHPLLILSLASAAVLNWRTPRRRRLILGSLAIYVVVLVATSVYFLPELRAFAQSAESGLEKAEWKVRGQQWQRLSWIRGALCFVGFYPLLFALTIPPLVPAKESE
jgi:hypothetical protein